MRRLPLDAKASNPSQDYSVIKLVLIKIKCHRTSLSLVNFFAMDDSGSRFTTGTKVFYSPDSGASLQVTP